MATGFLTTHVLDTSKGRPARGLHISLYGIAGSGPVLLNQMVTNEDGRTDSPILGQADFRTGQYELIFAAGDYLRAHNISDDILFLDEIPIRFGIDDADQHYHVPLLLSPYGYSTYRGS